MKVDDGNKKKGKSQSKKDACNRQNKKINQKKTKTNEMNGKHNAKNKIKFQERTVNDPLLTRLQRK